MSEHEEREYREHVREEEELHREHIREEEESHREHEREESELHSEHEREEEREREHPPKLPVPVVNPLPPPDIDKGRRFGRF